MSKGKRQTVETPILNRVPTMFDIQEAMRGVAEEAFGTVVQVMRNGDSESNRLAASKMLIEYVAGKPRQDIGVSGELKVTLTQEQHDAAMRAMLYGEGE